MLLPLLLISVYSVGVLFPTLANEFGGLTNIVPFITALLTYFYVVLTASMVQTMIRTQEEASRARVRLTLEFEEGAIVAVIRNLGGFPAYDLQIQFVPITDMNSNDHAANAGKASDQISTNEQPLFHDKPIAFMPPGYMIRTSIGYSTDLLKDDAPRDYSVALTYALVWKGEPITETYTVNIPRFKRGASMAMADMNDLVRSVRGLGRKLESLEHSLQPSTMHDMFYGPVRAIHLHNVEELKEAASELLSARAQETPKAATLTHHANGAAPNAPPHMRSRIKLAVRVLLGFDTD